MKKASDQSVTKLADAAFQQAARKVLEIAQESGTPIIIWDGQAVKAVRVPTHNNRKRKLPSPI